MRSKSTIYTGLLLPLIFVFLTACSSNTQSGSVQLQPESIGQVKAEGAEHAAGRISLDLNDLYSDTGAYLAGREIVRFEHEDVYFDYDKADLKPLAAAELMRKAQWLKKHPEVVIVIEGHCDERGTNGHNLGLGEKRAGTIKSFLIQQGIDQNRMTTISYGEERPVDEGHNEEAWAKNRRGHISLP